MSERKPASGACLFCGAHIVVGQGGQLQWCEDGCPIHCDRHFDEGGWEVICVDDAACCGRREERATQTRAARAQREADDRIRRAAADAKDAQDTATAATILNGLSSTGYSPYYTTQSLAPLGRPVAEATGNGRLPDGCGWTKIYRCPEGYVSVFSDSGSNVVTAWSTPKQCDAWRLASAIEDKLTAQDAADGIASPYIGDDQRRMYEVTSEYHVRMR